MSTEQSDRSTITREVRFAVVMYGGVSLAIYINGIAQELLRLVRATAPRLEPNSRAPGAPRADRGTLLVDDARLIGSERVYRRLGQLIDERGSWDPAAARSLPGDAPVRTRFVVDILSGTSAGGINGVFLAKALARGESLQSLARLWVEEGAIEVLLNDHESKFDGFGVDPKPASLLNSRRMYRKLVDALEGMDDAPGAAPHALAREVDLFVTTTDIAGLPIALRLADGVVAERRHRNVFHFRFSDGQNSGTCDDFRRDQNPFLAFAARCTSSFPFAFEPMTLGDIDEVLERRGARALPPRVKGDGTPWRRYFPAYTGVRDGDGPVSDPDAPAAASRCADPWLHEGRVDIANRPFGDGGYLDNKPFEYAIGALAGRRAGVPVDRKLLYIEPSPEHAELAGQGDERPNAFENVHAALSLARYETIRSDLERVLQRNRLVERVDRIIVGIDDDVTLVGHETSAGALFDRRADREFLEGDLAAMIRQHGIAYGGYHRLKVSTLTDEIADYISRVAGFNEQSDEFQAVRHLVATWRRRWYAPYFAPADGSRHGAVRITSDSPRNRPGEIVRTEGEFLLRYDLSFRIRRLSFVLSRIDRLVCADVPAAEMLARRGLALPADGPEREAFVARLRDVRDELARWLVQLRERRFLLLSRDPGRNPLAAAVDKLALSREDMREILAPATTEERREAAWALIERRGLHPRLSEIERALGASIGRVSRSAARACARVAPPPPVARPATDARGSSVADAIVRICYWDYDRYDQLILPAFFATDVGEEAGVVDVHRVSPEDAPALIDERSLAEGRRKLAGNALAHFGAFLDRRWRWNDIMWGRLDGAERLITALLPGDGEAQRAARARLVAEAHGAILDEEMRKKEADGFSWATEADREAIREMLRLPPEPAPAPERAERRERVLAAFRAHYRVDGEIADLEPEHTLRIAARATRVVGKMFDRVTEDYALAAKPAVWLSRAGALAWGVVEVAVPRSMRNLTARYWIKLVYAFEVMVIALGWGFDRDVLNFGFRVLGLTIALHMGALLVQDIVERRTSWYKRIAAVAALALALTLSAGALLVIDAGVRASALDALSQRRPMSALLTSALQAVLVGAGLCAALVGGMFLEARRRSILRIEHETGRARQALARAWTLLSRAPADPATKAAEAAAEPFVERRRSKSLPSLYDRRATPLEATKQRLSREVERVKGWLGG